MRIVSLLPSATEIVVAIGAGDELVGISHECDFPPAAVRGRPVVTRSRLAADARSSRAIDEAVRAAISDALSLYAVDAAQLGALRPDVIITQDLCEVCAVSLDDLHAAVARLADRLDVRVVTLHPTRLDDVLDDLVRVGDAITRGPAARALRANLQARLDSLRARTAALAKAAAAALSRGPARHKEGPEALRASPSKPRIATLEWIDPIMLGGTWMPDLIDCAGGVAIGVTAGAPAPTVTVAELAALAPDVVVLKPCGFSLTRALEDTAAIASLRAALGAHVRIYASDGNQFFNRPGPRLVESAEILAACLHPDACADLARTHAAAIQRL